MPEAADVLANRDVVSAPFGAGLDDSDLIYARERIKHSSSRQASVLQFQRLAAHGHGAGVVLVVVVSSNPSHRAIVEAQEARSGS